MTRTKVLLTGIVLALAWTGQTPAVWADVPCDAPSVADADVQALAAAADCLRAKDTPSSRDRAIDFYAAAASRGDLRSTLALAQLLAARRQAGDFPRAIAAYLKVASRLADRGDTAAPLLSSIYADVGDLQRQAGDAAAAVQSYETADQQGLIAGRTAKTDPAFHLRVQQNLGFAAESLAHYSRALAAYASALRAAAHLGDETAPRAAALHSNIGVVYYNIGSYAAAETEFRAAIEDLERREPQAALASAYSNLGLALAARQSFGETEQALRDSLRLRQRLFGPSSDQAANAWNNLGVVYTQWKHFDAAEEALAKALAIRTRLHGTRHALVSQVLDSIAGLRLNEGRLDDALRTSLHSMDLWLDDQASNLDDLRQSYERIATILHRKGAVAGSVLFAKLGINAHHAIRRENRELRQSLSLALAGRYRDLYQNLSSALIADGAFTEAQHVLILLKQRELSDYTSAALIDPAVKTEGIRLTPREEQMWDDLVAHSKDGEPDGGSGSFVSFAIAALEDIEAERAALQQERLSLQASYVDDASAMTNNQGTVLLRMVALDDALHLFVVRPGHQTVHRIVTMPRTEVARLVYATIDDVRSRAVDADGKLEDLRQLLIAPVADDLRAAKPQTLLIDASGFLRYVPFAALKADGRYLVEDYDLAFLTPAVSARRHAGHKLSGQGVGFGVTRALAGFAPLPGVRTELSAIFGDGTHAGVVKGKAMIDADFTLDHLKAALADSPDILHLATHFKLEAGNENNSYLLLGDGRGLTLNSLRSDEGLRFAGLDLITLSACETAVGGGSEGNEIDSLAALAQVNGAATVVATLWPISDAASASVMADFYANLAAGEPKAEALANAQRAAIAAGPGTSGPKRGAAEIGDEPLDDVAGAPASVHPFQWAPFILMGDWQ